MFERKIKNEMGIFISCCKGDIDETEKLSPTLVRFVFKSIWKLFENSEHLLGS